MNEDYLFKLKKDIAIEEKKLSTVRLALQNSHKELIELNKKKDTLTKNLSNFAESENSFYMKKIKKQKEKLESEKKSIEDAIESNKNKTIKLNTLERKLSLKSKELNEFEKLLDKRKKSIEEMEKNLTSLIRENEHLKKSLEYEKITAENRKNKILKLWDKFIIKKKKCVTDIKNKSKIISDKEKKLDKQIEFVKIERANFKKQQSYISSQLSKIHIEWNQIIEAKEWLTRHETTTE